jgi:hypothetical protein
MNWLLMQAVMWALMIAWIAQTAQSRGRSIIGWSLGGAVAGALAFVAGAQLLLQILDDNKTDTSAGDIFLGVFAPTLFMMGAMAVIGTVLHREPVKVALRKLWSVHVVGRGDGKLRIEAGLVELSWPQGSLSKSAALIEKVEADGEAVRVTIGGDESAILPTGKPETRDGRIAQSAAIARQLRKQP